MTLKITLWG